VAPFRITVDIIFKNPTSIKIPPSTPGVALALECPLTGLCVHGLGMVGDTFLSPVVRGLQRRSFRLIYAINEECFESCEILAEIIFEAGSRLRRIEERAFRWTDLSAITIPSSVKEIGASCFSSCRYLSQVLFDPKSRLRRIRYGALCMRDMLLMSQRMLFGPADTKVYIPIGRKSRPDMN
jgi:hypothetical protein